MPMADAIDQGADAFFDEKYGETVRTIRVQDYSFELCGGTHCRATGQIGGFVITGERSIGSGQRRIEAVTGAAADGLLRERSDRLERVATAVGAQNTDSIEDRIAALQDELRATKARIRAGGGSGLPRPADLAARAEDLGRGRRAVIAAIAASSLDELKGLARDTRTVLGDGVIALALEADEPQLFVTVSDDLVGGGVSAGDLVRVAMPYIDGKGGGRAEMAQGKGSRRDGLADALGAVRSALISEG
jgi:alanyl-tRNA synthetase